MKGYGGEGDITALILNLGTAWCELPAATTSLPVRKEDLWIKVMWAK
jgi:hypothetical protein